MCIRDRRIGADEIRGFAGADTLQGGIGADSLFGGLGPDILNGGFGPDRLEGRLGQDKFRLFKNGGKDVIVDFQDDIDTIQLDRDLWDGDLTKAQVIDRFAEVVDGGILFDFGAEELRINGFTNLAELPDDLAFI